MTPQLSFGDFIKISVGTKWVYAQRRSERIAQQYPDSVVILPKQQRDLARAYKAKWGREHDPEAWLALCALRAATNQLDYASFDAHTQNLIENAIKALTT